MIKLSSKVQSLNDEKSEWLIEKVDLNRKKKLFKYFFFKFLESVI